MSRLRRDSWYEWGDGYTLAIEKWTTDSETLYTALCDTGWFSSPSAARSASENADLYHAWLGADDYGDHVMCDADGQCPDGSPAAVISPLTVADVQAFL